MTDRFALAMTYAESLHRGQSRKGSGCPYIAHLLGVASLVMEGGGTEDECIAALLHDAVEDQGGVPTAAEIRRRFGPGVARIVDYCSEPGSKVEAWIARKESAVRRVSGCGHSALLVLSADKLHNARSLIAAYREVGEDIWECFRGRRDGTLWYYRAMADAIARAGGSPLLGELESAVSALESLARRGQPD